MRRCFFSLVFLSLSFVLAGCSGGGGSKTSPISSANNPVPTVNALSPTSVPAGSPALSVMVTGTGYINATTATLNGVSVQTNYVSATNLQATVPAATLAAGQVADFVVTNPSPGGGASAAVKFSIMSPTPVVSGVSPRSVPQGLDALITVSGSGFEANSVVLYNGSARPTTFVNSTTLQAALTANDVKSFGTGEISVYNPGPGGSTSTPTELTIAASTPTITGVSPSSLAPNPNTNVPASLYIYGSGFAPNATVQANGTLIPVSAQSGTNITASLAPSFFAASGSIQIVVSNPGSPVVQSNVWTITVVAPTATLSLSPDSAPAGSPDTTITLRGSGFTKDSVVKWNDISLATTFTNSNSYQITAVVPAALISGFTQASIQVSTPGATTPLPAQTFTTYLPLPTNDIAYNKADGLIYASVPGSAGGDLGNTIAAIDPNSGAIVKTIPVGSEPARISISSDGTQLFVGLNGAGAVRQVNLTTGTAGIQFSLGGGTAVYSPTNNAADLQVLPGQPNSVAVYTSSGGLTIYDSGIARPNSNPSSALYTSGVSGSLSFGSSASTLYLSAGTLYSLTIDSSGSTSPKNMGNGAFGNYPQTIQYDNNRIYVGNGAVLDAATGNQVGQFSIAAPSYSNTGVVPAAGPMVSDSALGRAWSLPTNTYVSTNVNQIIAFDETTFNPIGSQTVTGLQVPPYLNSASDMIRWGQNGLAFRTASQLFVLKSSLVKDLSASPANLAVSISGSTTATTGTASTYTIRVANQGQNAASGVVLTTVLPSNVIGGTFTASQGSCSGSQVLYCDFGDLANGSSATLTFSITPTTAGTLSLTSYVSSVTVDPVSSNDQASTSITVTGNDFNASPVVTQIVPQMIPAGSGTVLTVDGAGFVPGSSILWNGQALPTTFVSSGQMTATVDSSLVPQLGWAQISVQTPAPGGGQATGLPVYIYKLLDVPANVISFDPFTRKIYAALPSTSASISGNSILPIDPFTGSTGSPIQVGSEPNLLSETSDGKYLYIGLSGAKSIGRFNLQNQSLDLTVPITYTSPFTSTPTNTAARGIATLPGSNSTLAVDVGGVGIFDISGNTGTFRSKIANYTNAIFADATHLYTYDSGSTGAQFNRYTIDASGANFVDSTTLNGIGGFNGKIAIDSGLVFGAAGGIVNPNTTPPSQIAVLPISTSPFVTYSGVIPYQTQFKAFVYGVNGGNVNTSYLQRFDTQLFTVDDRIQLPSTAASALTGIRFGQDGLAYIIPTSSNSSQGGKVLLFKGPFVLPAETVANSAPVLNNISQTTVSAGSGNLYLTITGTGFLPGAAAHWNGAERTTTYTDNAHLQVAIPAADLATAKSNSVTVQNPGSGDSNALSVQVQ